MFIAAESTSSGGGACLAVAVILVLGAVLLGIYLKRGHEGAKTADGNNENEALLESDTPGRVYPSLPGDAHTVPDWISNDAPFDVASAFAAVPSEENAAPFYLDALYDFAPKEMAACISPEERRLRGRAARERHSRLAHIQSQDPTTVTLADRSEIVSQFSEPFDKLIRAHQRSVCFFEAPPGIESGAAPHAVAARAAAHLSVWKTEMSLARGRIHDAIDDVELVLRLGRALRPRGNLFCQVASVSVDIQALEGCLTQILNARGVGSRDCERLQDLLARHVSEGTDPLSEGLRFEYMYMRDLLHRLALKEDLAARLGWPGLTYGQISADFAKLLGQEEGRERDEIARRIDQDLARMSAADFAAEVEILNRSYRLLMDAADRRERRLDAISSQIKEIVEKSKLLNYFVASFEATNEAFRRGRLRIGGFQCLVALRRWKLEYGDKLPPDLATVCKSAGMDAVPVDEPSGEPFQGVVIDEDFVISCSAPIQKVGSGSIENQPPISSNWVFRLGPV
jgi:hypothetical protein